MAKPSPLARVKSQFGTKKDLVEKVKTLATEDLWINRLNENTSWGMISNTKLLRLHAVLSETKERFGTREKLVDALVTAKGHAKDQTFRKQFAEWPLPRLLDALKATQKQEKASAKPEAKN